MPKPISRLLPVLLLVAAPAFASHDWNGYHWSKKGSALSLKVGDNVTSAWDAYLDGAIADWNVSNVLTLTEVAASLNPRTCKGVTGRIDVCNSKYGNNGWLGIAQIWLSGGHIVKGITKLNDTYYAAGTYNTPAWRRFVTCQEIGHDFGLAHVNETFNDPNTGSCMDYTNDPNGGAGGVSPSDPSNEHPNAHDYNLLSNKYTHVHSTASVTADSAFPAAADQLDLNHRASWGRLVAHAAGHGVETYELDFGGGRKIVTHVTWTLEAAAKRRAEVRHEE
jgi:hypothetical protein